MKIEDSFRVEVPVDEAWRVITDLERQFPGLRDRIQSKLDADRQDVVARKLAAASIPTLSERLAFGHDQREITNRCADRRVR